MEANSLGYTHQIDLPEDEKSRFLALCKKVIPQLGWEIKTTSTEKYIVSVPGEEGEHGEVFTIEVNDSGVLLNSISLDETPAHEKNYENVTRFLTAIDNLKADIEAGVQVEELPDKGRSGLKSFLYTLTPRKDYLFTPLLIAINVLVFVVMVINGVHFFEPDAGIMLDWGANFSGYTLNGQPWRLLTACFLHYGIFHLVLNMYALLFVGVLLEPIIGKWRFIGIYLIAGIGGNIASMYFNTLAAGAGASGAIFGLYGAFLALLTTNIIEREARSAFLGSMVLFVGYNLFYGFTKSNIDNSAHIGGLLTGAAVCYLFCIDLIKIQKTQKAAYKASVAGLLVAVVGLTVAFSFAPSQLALFEQNRQEFVEMETEALKLVTDWENTTNEQKIVLLQEGKEGWLKCLELMDLKHFDNLPGAYEHERRMCFEYSLLRKRQYEAIEKWFETGDEKYDTEIGEFNNKIDSLMGKRMLPE